MFLPHDVVCDLKKSVTEIFAESHLLNNLPVYRPLPTQMEWILSGTPNDRSSLYIPIKHPYRVPRSSCMLVRLVGDPQSSRGHRMILFLPKDLDQPAPVTVQSESRQNRMG